MNRLQEYFDRERRPPQGGMGSAGFVECPAIFTCGLSPEEFKARQQLYRTAYERAWEQCRQEEGDVGFGAGI